MGGPLHITTCKRMLTAGSAGDIAPSIGADELLIKAEAHRFRIANLIFSF